MKVLRKWKEKGAGVEFRRRNLIHEEDKEDSEEETSLSTLQRFNDKLKKKEQERLQRINQSAREESSPDDTETSPPKNGRQHEVFNSEFDDSQETQSDVILSYPSTTSSEVQRTFDSHIPDNQSNEPQRIDSVDGGPFEDIQTFSGASDYDENDFEEEENSCESMDVENAVELVDLADENNVNPSDSSHIVPVTGVRTSSYPHGNGRVPSLVTEKTAEWLVDDVGPRAAKRKRPAKQTTLTGSTERRKRPSTAARPSPRLKLSKSKPSLPKQTRLVVPKEPRAHQNTTTVSNSFVNRVSAPVTVRSDVVSTVAAGNARINTPQANIRHNVAPGQCGTQHNVAHTAQGGTPPMRLRVRVQDKVFLIPCPRSNAQESKNIGWLAEQVKMGQIFSFFTVAVDITLSLAVQQVL